jgi:uncharacterized protein with FMN-binding domain
MPGGIMKKRTEKRNPLSPRNNYYFKRIFGDERDKDILTDFLKAALDIPTEEYGKVDILNPSSNAERGGDKIGIIDVKVRTKSGKIIAVEIQRYGEYAFRERIVYEASKLIEEQINAGDHYRKIHKAICIVITEFKLIAEKNEGVRRAVKKYKDLTADASARAFAEAMAKQERIKEGQIIYAKDEGRTEGRAEGRTEELAEVARRMKAESLDTALISKVTGLSADEIGKL